MTFFWPKVALFPGTQPMTIGAEQLQIPLALRPIVQAACPTIMSILRLDFLRCVNMVNIQHTKIIDPTLDAFPTKLSDQCKFALPVAGLFAVMVMRVMIGLLTDCRAKAYRTGLPTLLACAVFTPSRRHVTRLITVFSRPFFDAIRMHSNGLTTMRACHQYLCCGLTRKAGFPRIPGRRAISIMADPRTILTGTTANKLFSADLAGMVNAFHGYIVLYRKHILHYFDIACQRITDAYAQPDLFVPQPTRPQQQALFAGGTHAL